jgi:hypothetical protein
MQPLQAQGLTRTPSEATSHNTVELFTVDYLHEKAAIVEKDTSKSVSGQAAPSQQTKKCGGRKRGWIQDSREKITSRDRALVLLHDKSVFETC